MYDPRGALTDMRRFTAVALGAVERGREAYEHDEDTRALRPCHLLLLGEAANRVRRDRQALLPAIPWAPLVALRNRLLHQYERIDADLVWRIAEHDVPALLRVRDAALDRHAGP